MAAIIAGQVDIIMASSQVAKPLVEDKRIRALAVTGKERSPALPDVPTMAEAGVSTPTSISSSGLAYLDRRVDRPT